MSDREGSTDRPISTEEAFELFLEERKRGVATDPSTFVARHPELGAELESALEALLVLERTTRSEDDEVMPDRIGDFRVVREIGRGGMGVVLEAIEEPLHRRVALKVLPALLLSSTSARARFKREAELAARLDHSGIATVYGAGVDGDRPWIAMRYVEGKTLARWIADARAAGARSVSFEAPDASPRAAALAVARCIARVARALQSAHEEGVVHRDVKPSNVILAPDGSPVLVDFGLALAEESDGRTLTRSGETAGTPAYLAPEIVSGDRARPDVQSDVYALGVTLYECLALRRPFEAPTPIALYRAIATDATPDVRAHNRDVSRDLAVVVATALERDRSRRYASAAALADDLEAAAQGRPIAARPVPLTGRVMRWARREPRQALLASLLGVATIAAAVLAGTWWQSRSEVRAAERLTTGEKLEMALQSGYAALATNWLPEGEAWFEQALEISPRNPEAIGGLALVRMKQHRDAAAVEALALAPRTRAFDALRALARGELPDADQDAAWFATAPAIEMFIDGMRLMKQIERTPRHEREHLAKIALARFEEAVKRSTTARMIYQVERANAARDAGDEDAIRSAAAALVVLWPDQERALFTAGLALYAIDARAAVPLLERAIALDPTWGAPNQILGNALFGLKDFEGAARAARRAIALDPRDADAYNSLGLSLDELDCAEDARGAFRAALAIRPMWETWANLGIRDETGPDPEAAELELRVALNFVPRESLVRLSLARLLHDLGRESEAMCELETVIGFDPENPVAWRLFARWQSDLGDDDASERANAIVSEIAARRP